MGVRSVIKNRRLELQLTMKEVAEKVGVSEATVSRWESGDIENMRRDKIAALAKALQITPAVLMGWDELPSYPNVHPVASRKLPMLGSVPCGEPVFMSEEYEFQVDTTDEIKADFVLKCKGDSMIGARIYDGDIVFVRKQETVENGEIAVVAVEDEATLKRFYKYNDLIVLRAENPAYKAMVFTPADHKQIRILGKAVWFQGRLV